MTELLEITPALSLPATELRFRFARSGGPGGQNVNKTATQVELLFDVAHSPSLSDTQRDLLLRKLANRIDGDGVLHLVSHATRSQLENRADATARFVALVAAALKPARKRRPTAPTGASRERRIQAKKERGQIKARRRAAADD
ncbi:MAG: aminoacyl-tRNA hydrolase [Chloroflexi bacterium]|nr:aminoacyl-tRNA hydrolase [Chloroflexota bacterium]